ncbi:hypothetical protein K1719_032723 [Acacia pycnantha]|nr:hypothetical protein K1719_032723 [Acacia pycnantha]
MASFWIFIVFQKLVRICLSFFITVRRRGKLLSGGERERYSVEEIIIVKFIGGSYIFLFYEPWDDGSWPSEHVLAYYCLSHAELFRHKKVIELGSGYGLSAFVIVAVTEASEVVISYGNPQVVNFVDKPDTDSDSQHELLQELLTVSSVVSSVAASQSEILYILNGSAQFRILTRLCFRDDCGYPVMRTNFYTTIWSFVLDELCRFHMISGIWPVKDRGAKDARSFGNKDPHLGIADWLPSLFVHLVQSKVKQLVNSNQRLTIGAFEFDDSIAKCCEKLIV